MKIHVYTIAKNEEQFCERWVKACSGADGLHVLDTGSSDTTVEKLRSLGVNVSSMQFKPWKTLEEYDILVGDKEIPWRFDIPRNANLGMIPLDVDVCIQVDMDEVLVDNWREIVERHWTPGTTRLDYLYAWSMNGDQPLSQFHYNKCHSRIGYKWVRPVHEVLWPTDGFKEKFAVCNTLLVKHFPAGKDRSSYLHLLKLSCRENPEETMNSFNLAREFTFHGMWRDAINEVTRYLSLPGATWGHERCCACLLAAKSYGNIGDKFAQEKWLLRAASEDHKQREGWCELADFYRIEGQYLGGYFSAKKAISVAHSPMSHHCSVEAWREKPHDIASVCGFYAGFKSESLDHAWKAIKENPFDDRLVSNYEITQSLMSSNKNNSGDPVVDVVILSWSKDEIHYKMGCRCISNLRLSSSVAMNIVVVETNKNIAHEKFVSGHLFGENVIVICPDEPFGYNRYLQIANEKASPSAKYVMILNNDVVAFSRDFMSQMILYMDMFSSISPLGLREHKWGRIDESKSIHTGYDLNVINGWCIMFDKAILGAIPFDGLFPRELEFHRQDEYYAEMLKRFGIRHALICPAQALHLQAQSHSLIDPETKNRFTIGAEAPYLKLLSLK